MPTPYELLERPTPMLAWLRRHKPRAVVTRNLLSSDACLAANFLIAKGHPSSAFSDGLFDLMPCGGWLGNAINHMPADKPVTAQRAIAAIKATAKRKAASKTRRAA